MIERTFTSNTREGVEHYMRDVLDINRHESSMVYEFLRDEGLVVYDSEAGGFVFTADCDLIKSATQAKLARKRKPASA